MTTTTTNSTTTSTTNSTRVFGRAGGASRRSVAVRRGRAAAAAAAAGDDGSESSSVSAVSALTWEYETIAGRCAMAGYAIGASREATEGATMLEQLGRDHLIGTMILCAAIGWASVAPFEFNPQEYEANPKGLMEKKGMSGFAAMEELNLNAMVEETHGRLAMCGFVGTALVELVTRAPVFGH